MLLAVELQMMYRFAPLTVKTFIPLTHLIPGSTESVSAVLILCLAVFSSRALRARCTKPQNFSAGSFVISGS